MNKRDNFSIRIIGLLISVILIGICLGYFLMTWAGDTRAKMRWNEVRKAAQVGEHSSDHGNFPVFSMEKGQEKDQKNVQTDVGTEGAQEEFFIESEEIPSLETTENPIQTLQKINPDCVGWISIEGTNIDYPVLYHPEEEEYYLHRNFYQEEEYSGSIYLSENCTPGSENNKILYGHNMKNGSMFAGLMSYKDEEFYSSHPVIQYMEEDGVVLYDIASVFLTNVSSGNDFDYYNYVDTQDKEQFEAFWEKVRDKELYEIRTTVFTEDSLILLSTCEYSEENSRLVVVAKRRELAA